MLDLFNSQWTSPSAWAIGSIALAALVGSLHCVGMCGPLQTALLQGKKTATLLHQLGRLIGYVLLGLAFYSLGSLLEDHGFMVLQRAALAFYLFFLIAFASSVFGFGRKLVPTRLKKLAMLPQQKLQKLKTKIPENLFYFIAGFLTFLLPCGWLYAFALLAASSPTAEWAAVMMTVFALGTAPALISTQWAWLRLKRHPALTKALAIIVLVFGILSLTHRIHATAHEAASHAEQKGMSCH